MFADLAWTMATERQATLRAAARVRHGRARTYRGRRDEFVPPTSRPTRADAES